MANIIKSGFTGSAGSVGSPDPVRPPTDLTERRLLLLAAAFVCLYALGLSLSPAARLRSWQVELRWQHWVGVVIWAGVYLGLHLRAARRLPQRDPFLLPVAALLSGWGLLTIWRLLPGFGLRQAAWLGLAGLAVGLGMELRPELGFLRRYKYVWLSGSLLLTAATLIFGVNPLGYGPEMWLGCCGMYLQPSEPLKLLLLVYLAAFMADRQPYLILATAAHTPLSSWLTSVVPLLAPTGVMTGLALALLIVQRDLGTAFIFIFVYAASVYVAVGRRRTLALTGILLAGAGLLGYSLYDVVRLRVDAWLNPWLDPAGRSYQIVQSLIAIANGGLGGRGPGLGSPALAPLAHSDLIFAAIAEEFGLAGVVILLGVLALLAVRGILVAMRAGDHFRRYLAAGLTTLLVGQALLIIAGNLRLLPLTGVTLPFVSYGGSSLLTSSLALLLLLLISHQPEPAAARLYSARPYLHLAGVLLLVIAAAALVTGWWAVYRGPALLARTDNQRRAIADRYVQRGALLDRSEAPLAVSSGQPGDYVRRIDYPALSNVIGYTDPTYGQAGLEAGLDETLRGMQGQPWRRVLVDRLLYGQPPPGLDVRLSLDLALQRRADQLLQGHTGALVLLDARSGQILVMASHPTFDANYLGEEWDHLVADPRAPLLNRAALGLYPLGDLEPALFHAGVAALELDTAAIRSLPLQPALPAVGAPTNGERVAGAGYSPLQVALAAAALSGDGRRPAPLIALGARRPGETAWLAMDVSTGPADERPQVYAPQTQAAVMARYTVTPERLWQVTAATPPFTGVDTAIWSVAGTPPTHVGPPYAIALLLEENDPALAEQIVRAMMDQVLP